MKEETVEAVVEARRRRQTRLIEQFSRTDLEIANRLRARIEYLRLKQVDVAVQCWPDLSPTVARARLANYLNYQSRIPAAWIPLFAKTLRVSCDWLCGIDRDFTPKEEQGVATREDLAAMEVRLRALLLEAEQRVGQLDRGGD